MSEEENEALIDLEREVEDGIILDSDIVLELDTAKIILKMLKNNNDSLLLQDRILRLMVKDMQEKGMWEDMKYESVIEDYKRRRNL